MDGGLESMGYGRGYRATLGSSLLNANDKAVCISSPRVMISSGLAMLSYLLLRGSMPAICYNTATTK